MADPVVFTEECVLPHVERDKDGKVRKLDFAPWYR